MEIQKTSNSQSYLEREVWSWLNQPTWIQVLLQSHSYQDRMVLAQRQKYRSMEQNRKPRDKSTHICTPYLWQRRHHITRTDSDLFLFTAEQYSIVYMYHNFFIHSSLNGYHGCFHVLCIVKVLLWTLGYMCLFKLLFPQNICLGVGLLSHMVDLLLAL